MADTPEICNSLHSLDEREDIRNIVIIDYGSLKRKQDDLTSILQCWFLKKYFHVIFIVHKSPISSFNIPVHFNQMCTTLPISPFVPARPKYIDYLVTQIIIYVVDNLKPRVRRAYYCLSTEKDFLTERKFMNYREHVYCSVIRSVEYFLELKNHFLEDADDPCKMNVFPILKNSVPRNIDISNTSGKLMFFVKGELFHGDRSRSVKHFWHHLKQFGDEHGLHVNVTTAFPSVDKKVIQQYPVEITIPESYRLTIYLLDCCEHSVCTVLEHLQPSKLSSLLWAGSNWSVKLDKSTENQEFGRYGHKNISKGTYQVCFDCIKKMCDGTKNFEPVEDDQIKQLIQEAKEMGRTMKIRHAKALFCGPSGVGKTSFVRLLKNQKFIYPQSTGVGSIQQIMLFKKASIQGTKWVNLNLTKEIEQLRLRLYHNQVSNFIPTEKEQMQTPVEQIDFEVETDDATNDYETVHIKSSSSIPPSLNIKQTSDIGDVEKRLCTLSPALSKDTEKPPPIWDILTLLDTGGQPQFINMLPAVNTSATVTFVVMNMLNCVAGLNDRVVVHQYDKRKPSYALNYTNKDLIKCLVALLKDSVLSDTVLPGVEISEKAKDGKPGLCFVGTHLDKVQKEDTVEINVELEKLVSQLEPNDDISIWNRGGNLFPVDNTIAGKEDDSQQSIASEIRHEVKNMIENKAIYEVPIAWILLELEIRQMCTKQQRCYAELPDVIKLYSKIMPHLSEEDVEQQTKAALQFHHKFGVLLYFHDVIGMNNYVISNIQWLFTNLTNIVTFSFEGMIVNQDIKTFNSRGVLSRSLMQKIDIKFLEGIKLEYFFELLKKLKITTPYPNHDSNDYLILTVLKYQEENDLFNCNAEGTALAMQYESGSFPRGTFSCLIVQLIEDKREKWKLEDSLYGRRCIFANMVVFSTTSGHYIILSDKVSFLEINIKSESYDSDPIYYEVQHSITKALLKVFPTLCLKYGFFCRDKSCLKPIMCLNNEHATENKTLPQKILCNKHGYMDLELHRRWYQNPRASVASKEVALAVFVDHHDELYSLLSVILDNLMPELISKEVINHEEKRDISYSSSKPKKFLAYIEVSLKFSTGCFYTLLDVLEEYNTEPTRVLLSSIRKDLEYRSSLQGLEANKENSQSKKPSSPPNEAVVSDVASASLDHSGSHHESSVTLQNLSLAETLTSFTCTRELHTDEAQKVLKQVQILLIAVSGCEFEAVRHYLQPIFSDCLFHYTQSDLHYTIGKYGECNTAILELRKQPEENVSKMAISIFSNLDAIMSVGTISGIGSVKEFDIVMSTNICVYELPTSPADNVQECCIHKTIMVESSELLCNCFFPTQWPSDGNKLIKRLKGIKPCICQGTILSGPYHPDLNSQLLSLYPRAVGIDSQCADLFARNKNNTHVMVVKCVVKESTNQPIAALLAADCVAYYFSSNNPPLSYVLANSRDALIEQSQTTASEKY